MSEDVIRLTTDLHAFVREVEQLCVRASLDGSSAKRLERIATELARECEALIERGHARVLTELSNVRPRLEELRLELREQQPSLERIRARWSSVGHHYEALVAQLSSNAMNVPKKLRAAKLKPRNLARNAFHCANSLWAVALYQATEDRSLMLGVAGVFLLVAIGIETSRRLSPALNDWFCKGLFGSVARPHEFHQITAATWYALAMVLGVYFFPQHAVEAGALVLGVGDPVASLVGKTWGKRKIWGEKSLEGTLAFFGAAFLTLTAYFSLVAGGYSVLMVLTASAGIAMAGALVELVSSRIEDNFSIPLVAGWCATALLSLPF